MPSLSPDITAVISTHNRCAELKKTLEVLANLSPCPQVIVVDNASTDQTAGLLKQEFPWVTLISRPENHPIAGYNTGFRLAQTPYIWVMDDDATPAEGTLSAMLEALENQPECAAAAANILTLSGSSEWDTAPLPEVDKDWFNLIGCGFMIRREALMKCQGYCESFELYYNDLDLALRLLATGGRILFRRNWTVEHRAVKSAIRNRRKHVLMLRNFCFTIRNHFSGLQKWNLLIPHTVKFLLPAIRDAGLASTFNALGCGLTTYPGRDIIRPDDTGPISRFKRRYSLSENLLDLSVLKKRGFSKGNKN